MDEGFPRGCKVPRRAGVSIHWIVACWIKMIDSMFDLPLRFSREVARIRAMFEPDFV
jgi:hypothetical protein